MIQNVKISTMQYFTPDFVDFFKDLAANNHKEWFHANKKRYETSVKKPFSAFVEVLIAEIQKHDPELQVEVKDCLSRINRDIRFSKDKTPYNLNCTAFVSRGGKKDKSIPGIFLRFSPEEVGIMIGCFGLSKEQLLGVRTTIQNDLPKFQAVYSDPGLAGKFGVLKGEEHKRIPPEFKDTHAVEPLIARKQFYMVALKDPGLLSQEGLLEEIMDHWHTARPLNEYLMEAIQG